MTHIFSNFLSVATAASCLALCPGCDSGPGRTAVSGKVTFQGRPVTGGLINFKPASGRLLGGAIQADGTYQFNLPSGEYEVRIDTPPAMPPGWKEGDPPPQLDKRQVPLKYGAFQTSGLTASISDQENTRTLDFELK